MRKKPTNTKEQVHIGNGTRGSLVMVTLLTPHQTPRAQVRCYRQHVTLPCHSPRVDATAHCSLVTALPKVYGSNDNINKDSPLLAAEKYVESISRHEKANIAF